MLTFWASFDPFDIILFQLTLPKLVYLLTGTQGVQLLGWSNMGQIWTIRFWQVWGNWHPSIWWWSLWIGLSTCSHEPTLTKTEPASTQETLQVHVLQALKSAFQIKICIVGRQSSLGCGRCRLIAALVLKIGDWLCVLPAITLVVDKSRKLTKLFPQTDWWWTAKPTRQIPVQAFPPGGVRGHYIQRTLLTPLTWVTWVTIKTIKVSFDPSNIIKHIHALLWSFVLAILTHALWCTCNT